MTLPTTTGTNREHRKEAVAVGCLEETMPATATATAGAATLNQGAGRVFSEASLTTAAAAFYTLTLTNSLIDVNTLVFATAHLGSQSGASTQGHPSVANIEITANTATIAVKNVDAAAAFNGSIAVDFLLVRKAGAAL